MMSRIDVFRIVLNALVLCAAYGPVAPALAQSLPTPIELESMYILDGWTLELTRVASLSAGPSGQIAIPHERSVLIFDAEGSLVQRFGREGDGPGEFRAISSIGWRGDSVWVADGRLGRFTVWVPGSDRGNTYPMPAVAAGAGGLTFPKGYGSDGTILATILGELGVVRRTDVVGSHSEVVLAWDLPPEAPIVQRDGNQMSVAPPFFPRVEEGYAPDGSGVAVSVPLPAQNDQARARLARVDASGRPMFDRVVSIPNSRISRSLAADLVERAANAGPEGLREFYRRNIEIPEHYPAVSSVVADSEGKTWIQVPNGNDGWEFHGYDREGEHRWTLRLPEGQLLLAAWGDTLWSTGKDEFDVPSVYAYSIGG